MKKLFSILLIGFMMLMVGCTPNDEPAAKPQLSLTKGTATEVSVTFTVETKAVDKVAYLYTDDIAKAPSAEVVLAEGHDIEGNKVTEVEISNLEPSVTYTIIVAASGGGEVISHSIDMTTKAKEPEPTPEPEYLYNVEMATASRIPSAELDLEDNYFAIAFADENEEYELGIVLVGDGTHNSILTEEKYSATNENLMIEGCEFYTADGEYSFVDGEVLVAQADGVADVYNFDITLVDEQGNRFHFTYDGAVENMTLPEPEPEEVVLTQAKSTWKGQYHTVTFATADESTKLVADIYTYNYKFGYLYEGTYTVKNSGYSFTAGEIDYYYSSLTTEGEKAALDSGTIEVAINDDLSYSIVIDVVDANGRAFQNQYEGMIEGMSFENGFEWVAAARNTIVNSADGQFNITFKTAGTESADMITLDFYAEAGAERLPAGTYTIANSTEAGYVNLETLSFTTFSNGTPEIDGGEVVVEWLGENDYNVSFRMSEKDSRRTWICSYEGEIYNMIIEAAEEELNFISANGYFSDDSGESYVYLVADNGKQLKLGLIDLEWESSYVTPGTYTVGSDWGVGMINSGWYGTDWNDGISLKSGSAIFEDNGDQTYTITVNITLVNDEVCTGVYVGAIEGYTLPGAEEGGDDASTVELTIERIYARHYSGSNFGVQLFTPGSTDGQAGIGQTVAYMNLDFYTIDGSTTEITPGTYTVGNATAGHLDSGYTKVMMTGSKATSGEATFVLNADSTYTITFNITCQDGFTYKGSYTGELTIH
jgi:hypothetical protein